MHYSWICFVVRRVATMSYTTKIPTCLSFTMTLNDGVVMPMFGLGTYKMSSDETETVASFALQHGYHLLDTAAFYGCGPQFLFRFHRIYPCAMYIQTVIALVSTHL